MSDFLFQYRELEPTTWVYLSSLLMIGLFFKFGRCWSVRNLDLLLLILLAPGMLLIDDGQELQRAAIESRDAAPAAAGQETNTDRSAPGAAVADTDADETEWADQQIRGQRREVLGFVWLFGAGGLLLVRLLLDPMMVRRPLLEPNLSLGGLAFIGCALFVFLMANVVSEPADSNDPLAERVSDGIARVAPVSTQGPGYALLSSLPPNWSKSLSILAHLSIVIAMSLVGYRHFGNLVMGIGTATLYLMLPYTSLMTGRIDHVLPAATLGVGGAHVSASDGVGRADRGCERHCVLSLLLVAPVAGILLAARILEVRHGSLADVGGAGSGADPVAKFACRRPTENVWPVDPGGEWFARHLESGRRRLAWRISTAGISRVRRAFDQSGNLASTKEPGDRIELLGSDHGRDPILAWLRRWDLHGMVPAVDPTHDLPAQPGRSCRLIGFGR